MPEQLTFAHRYIQFPFFRLSLFLKELFLIKIKECFFKLIFIGGNSIFSFSQLELKLGLGGTSYEDFIQSMHLPLQLSQVDPIISSFSGGAVGVISALMLIEVNNVEQQQKKRCKYCHGAGYLACARCAASGVCASTEPVSVAHICGHPFEPPTTQRCPNCSGTGKVC
ncbi:protein ORANGE-LIKE, chloroplastic-like [Dendrobium catenatum]|uniref:protein ORANGE-LIKE, chloroplastic-like n=1 Tax=Dendrobium catenatum TaxID=906689 RepID=UPI00109EFB12|nr:protein ORANGE-LIKE, chloroplastic-like [Dendrobium catenatum]